jgi:hypothetical protein
VSDKETLELQEILAVPTDQARRDRQPPQPTESVEKMDGPTILASEYTQWIVLPNGQFAAAGATREKLPVGAYVLQPTQRGLIFEAKKILTDTLIDLGNSNSLRVIKGIQLFWKRRQRFLDRGILYKRGILMWGPPGSGKTATLALLVEDLIRQGGIVLLIQHPGTAVVGLQQLRKIEPERPLIVILEDVEEIIQTYGEHELLALLDGEHQTDNVVNIATTNYPELLGARIINRPSRFDEVVKIGMPSPEMRLQYLLHVLRHERENYPVHDWVEETEGMSIAHLKELVVAVTCLEQRYDEVISRLKTMKSVPRSSMYEGPVGFGLCEAKAEMIPSAVRGR